jgi:hypothetical protein
VLAHAESIVMPMMATTRCHDLELEIMIFPSVKRLP